MPTPTHTLRDGINVALPPALYELLMRGTGDAELIARSASFEALLEIRKQLDRCGYSFVGLARVEAVS